MGVGLILHGVKIAFAQLNLFSAPIRYTPKMHISTKMQDTDIETLVIVTA